MANTIHPVDVVVATGLPLYSGRMLRQVGSVAFAGATAARPFGVSSGVRPGTSTTTVTATATVWTVNPHAGLLDFEAAMESGPTSYAIDAAVTGAVRAADGFARVDLVWVRQDIPLEDGASVPAVVPGYTYGTVASTPPATPARCMVLAWVNVPASGGGSPTVTWKAPYAVAAGADMPVITRVSSGDVNAVASGIGVISAGAIPAVGMPTRVYVQVEGVAGNNGATAVDVSVDLYGSITPTQGTNHSVTAATAKWVTITRSGFVDVPANATPTIGVLSVQTAQAWFSVNMTLTRVNN